MRGVLKGLTAAYVIVAGTFAVLAVLESQQQPQGLGGWVQSRSADAKAWYARLKLRASPPVSITLPIGPFTVPLRGSLLEDPSPGPSSTPAAPSPVPPTKPSKSGIVQFAEAETLPAIEITPRVRLQSERVADRLRSTLAPALYANFDLFLYVSKADDGPWAQHMFVFAKQGRGKKSELNLLHTWDVSTGRETVEEAKNGVRMSTDTPAGFYQLDPDRFYRRYRSMQWGMQMPNSMFFNWMKNGTPTGLALHGVSTAQEIAQLGQRASAGCVHLSPDASAELFDLIRDDYRGMVPRFAFDKKTQTVSNDGRLARDRHGAIRMVDGYKALVFIENFGGEDRVSELYMDSPGTNG